MRRWAPRLLPCLLAVSWPAHAALQLTVEAGIPDAELEASRRLVEATLARLPPALQDWDATLTLGWRDDLPAQVHGRILRQRIMLDRALLAAWSTSGPTSARGAAMAALVHEIAHAWDLGPGGLSREPRTLDLAGWQVRPLWPGRDARNAFGERSPDAYELASPAEFVAVNLEHFLLDPAYACRRPSLHAHLSAHFGWSPPAQPCPVTLPYVDAGVLADADAAPLLELDPARVYAVDLLLADGSDAVMSRWGHSMLRLVVCAPGRAPGPECRLDLDHHRVLSFRAFVDDVQVSNWRGLTGGYPSRLFVLPLQQVIDEYTRVELRGLDSLPLRLDADDIAALLQRAARVHWSYDGHYRFVGNNCAVETFKLLHDGVPRLAAADLSGITPKGLLRRLRRAGVVDDAQVPAGAMEALRLGYRFEPWSTHYAALYEVARAELALPAENVEAWFTLPPQVRAEWLPHADMRASAALLLLEEAALQRLELRARDVLKRRLSRRDAGDLAPVVRAALRDGSVFSSPAELVSLPGYGLPQHEEREQARSGAAARAARLRGVEADLRAQARAWLDPGMRATLRQVEANVARIGVRLRALATPQRAG
ncbi:DUF4105 domain-containing protein [Luteimonas sp. MC1825]|uniref:DUF7844 domain-containing protein n=1 Tax=Luteimonas sp. MC1825 TaxID=2761107 RepID=UPI0016149471|nr:DUF4105 domain-containing protein [Luteimonas sp. MC1825]MBB6599637.1 DUF4105 domain-containing protein [Luteimonas sp. MC1825]QOC87327.1 DUF4105 domain-containing protein [Luteimonas sp. MC1825]